MKITLRSENCLSCGTCVALAPELFSIETGTVTLKKDPTTYTEEDKKRARDAAAACPNQVIEIVEE
jgi:ferredoxin